jgi:hypothetical protein
MVLDKFQVRTTGPVDPVTRQPVKVKKKVVLDATLADHKDRVANVLVVFDSEKWNATH